MFKKGFAVVLSFIIILGISPTIFAGESSHVDQSNVESSIVDIAYKDIRDQIMHDYDELYKLDNFTYEFTPREAQGQHFFDIDIFVDMTLTRHPAESPFVKGRRDQVENDRDAQPGLLGAGMHQEDGKIRHHRKGFGHGQGPVE